LTVHVLYLAGSRTSAHSKVTLKRSDLAEAVSGTRERRDGIAF
jgi:hypothetical protein